MLIGFFYGKIREGCKQYLEFSGVARNVAGGFFIFWLALFAFVVITALVALIRRRAKKKEDPEEVIKKFPETFK
ncbi:MAG: hypothetical protein V1493_00695 [Candidatus Diapherotrites archaeon]